MGSESGLSQLCLAAVLMMPAFVEHAVFNVQIAQLGIAVGGFDRDTLVAVGVDSDRWRGPVTFMSF